MLMPKNQLEKLVCCRGCGIPLQTHDPNNVGYVRFAQCACPRGTVKLQGTLRLLGSRFGHPGHPGRVAAT
eukprot:3280812-Alexandrium_andersonii.AAC.1